MNSLQKFVELFKRKRQITQVGFDEPMTPELLELSKISFRGRVAFALCCLDAMIEHFNYGNRNWAFCLDKLWDIVENDAEYNIERWFYEVPNYLPDCIAEFDTHRADAFEHIDEQTFYRLKQLYENVDESTCLVIGYSHEIVSVEMYGAVYKNGQSLYVLKKLITTMAHEKVPLPSIERFRKCEFKDGWGDVMDRTAFRV